MRQTKSTSSPGPFVGKRPPNWFDPTRFTDLPFLLLARPGGSNQPVFSQVFDDLFSWRFVAGDFLLLNGAQMSHSWDNGYVFPHIHICTNSVGSGNIVFRQTLYSRPAGQGKWSVANTVELTKAVNFTVDITCDVMDLWTGNGYQPAVGNTSTIFGGKLTLVSKTFAGNIFIDGWDAHFRQNRSGTVTEFGPN